jgi:hypothetical protein
MYQFLSPTLIFIRLQGYGCLTPLLTICKLYQGIQLFRLRKPEYQDKTTNLKPIADQPINT